MAQSLKIRTASNAYLFLRVFLFAVAVPYVLRLSLSRVAAILEPGSEPRSPDPDRIRKIAAYVETAIQSGRPLVRPGCLARGLTRYYFFRRAGMDVSLHFGMGRVGPQNAFDGHCWLVRDGEPYLENRDPRPLFTEMYCISRERARKPAAIRQENRDV